MTRTTSGAWASARTPRAVARPTPSWSAWARWALASQRSAHSSRVESTVGSFLDSINHFTHDLYHRHSHYHRHTIERKRGMDAARKFIRDLAPPFQQTVSNRQTLFTLAESGANSLAASGFLMMPSSSISPGGTATIDATTTTATTTTGTSVEQQFREQRDFAYDSDWDMLEILEERAPLPPGYSGEHDGDCWSREGAVVATATATATGELEHHGDLGLQPIGGSRAATSTGKKLHRKTYQVKRGAMLVTESEGEAESATEQDSLSDIEFK